LITDKHAIRWLHLLLVDYFRLESNMMPNKYFGILAVKYAADYIRLRRFFSKEAE
jgi:hypothetical protein